MTRIAGKGCLTLSCLASVAGLVASIDILVEMLKSFFLESLLLA